MEQTKTTTETRIRKSRLVIAVEPEIIERIRALDSNDVPLAVIIRRVVQTGLTTLEADNG